MNLEYIENTNSDYPEDSIIRLTHFSDSDLMDFVYDLKQIIEKKVKIEIQKKQYIRKSNCELEIEADDIDVGIIKIMDKKFSCKLANKKLIIMIDMINSFIGKNTIGKFQWLYDLNNPIDFLLSIDGKW
jgi:hypothetical protein